MKSGKAHQEEEEEGEEEVGTRREATPSTNNTRADAKNSDKANAIRSKHSVTEQRRRSKINERFQILRDLIPHSDQKRDTASFLLEVIQYVQYLQEKVQKYEGSYQSWNSEPTKLLPWRNSHWHVQNFVGQPQSTKNYPVPSSTFPGRFDENNSAVPSNMQPSLQNPVESEQSRDPQTELANKAITMPMPLQAGMPTSDARSTQGSVLADNLHPEELTIEGGTISISSVYSHRLLNSLTHALQSAGVDVSQANVSVQINLGKRANRGLAVAKDHENVLPSGNQSAGQYRECNNTNDFDQGHKRLKI